MKKLTFLLLLSIVLFSCKETCNTCEEYKGDFIYVADAAVLKGSDFIYGVTLDDMATELAKQVKPAQETEFDMVEVVVKGIVSPKPKGQEGWDEIITIKEIVMVSKTPSKIDIKLEDSKE